MDIDDQVRWAIFRQSDGKCGHCRTRLKWEEFDVRGRSGGWVLEIEAEGDAGDAKGKPFCFKCIDFPHRKSSGRLYTRAGFAAAGGEPPPAE